MGKSDFAGKQSSNELIFDFADQYLWHSVGVKLREENFYNYLCNAEDFVEKHQDVFRIVQELNRTPIAKLYNKSEHCHIIKDEHADKFDSIIKKKIKDVMKVADDKIDSTFEQLIQNEKRWQVSLGQGVTLMGLLKDNGVFVVLFIDYYHLLYSSVKYNNKRNPKNNFCPGSFRRKSNDNVKSK